MGDKDSLTKKFMQNPEVFADAFNYLIYSGEQVIQPDELEELDTANIVMPYGAHGTEQPTQRFRDVLKRWVAMRDKNATYLLLGVENQSSIHYAMPVRNMMYDVMSYDEQIRKITRNTERKTPGSVKKPKKQTPPTIPRASTCRDSAKTTVSPRSSHW